MAIYKPKRKINSNGATDDVKFPASCIEGLDEITGLKASAATSAATNVLMEEGNKLVYKPLSEIKTNAGKVKLTGDASGEANFDSTGVATISVAVADDSHNHTIANVDGLQAALNNAVTLNGTQTITGAKTYTGNNIFKNNYFEIKAGSANDDSWIKLTNSADSGYYAFGIRRPYESYGLQMKYHPADNSGDKYYNIYHAGNLTKSAVTSALGYTPPTTNTTYSVATTSADGLMSKSDKSKLDTLASYLANNHDDYVDSLAEIVAIFDTYPQGASVVQALSDKVDKVSGKGLSTNDFTAAYKSKLDGIASGANNYSHPTTSGNKHIPAGGSSGQILRWSADGTAVWGADNNTTYSNATTSAAGLMSSTDKAKLDGIASGANAYSHPTTTAVAADLYKIGKDSQGHVVVGDKVTIPADYIKITLNEVASGTLTSAQVTAMKNNPHKVVFNRGTIWYYAENLSGTYYYTSQNVVYDGSKINKHVLSVNPSSGAWSYSLYTYDPNVPTKVSQLTNDSGYITGVANATQSAAGLMSTDDKKKLDGIASGANAYSLPLAANGTRGGMQVGYTASGANLPVALSNEKAYVALTKSAVTSALGYTPPTTNTTYGVATTSADGLMSKTDKTRLDTLASYLTNNHDDYVDSLAEIMAIFDTYPQGASVVDALSGKVDKVSGKGLSTNDFTAAYKTKLDGIATGANNYSLPAATSSALGGVKIGSNITNSSGTISLTKANVTSALGYTPPTTDTTYSAATTSAAGLMSAADKTKVDNAVTLSDAQTISGTKTFSSHIKTAENVMGTKYRTHDSYETGVVYGTSGNEALTFAIQNPVTAFQIVYGTKPSAYASGTWQSVTPLFQTKDGKVIINRKIAATADTSALKLFDVNGDANATTLYESGTKLADKYQAKGNYQPAGNYLTGITKQNVTDALGYTPPTTNTTYNAATTSAAGLMSAADKSKLDGIASGANNFSLPTRLTNYTNASNRDATESGWYYAANMPETLGMGSNQAYLYTAAYSSGWASQIAIGCYTDKMAFRRNESGVWKDWKTVATVDQIPTFSYSNGRLVITRG